MPKIDILPIKEAGDGFMAQCTTPSGARHYGFIPGSLLRSRKVDFPAKFWNDIRFVDGLPENGEIEVADRAMSYGRFAQAYAITMDNITLVERCEANGQEPLAKEDGTIVPSATAFSSKPNAPEFISEADLQNNVTPAQYAMDYAVPAAAPVAPTPVPTDLAVPTDDKPAAAPAPAIDMNALAMAIAAALAQQQQS